MALKRIYTARDLADAHLIRSVLDGEGVPAVVMGESLQATLGALPFGESTLPSVWIHEERVGEAMDILARAEKKRAAGGFLPTVGPSWKCPNCGESIEGQFTDCWNCQTPRPVGQEAEVPKADLAADPTLGQDIACIRCGYNLRGLTSGHRCPECGLPAMRSVLDLLREGIVEDAEQLERHVRRPFEAVAAGIGYPAAALILVCHAWMRCAQPLLPSEQSPLIDADLLCQAIRGYATEYFGDTNEARRVMRGWNILSSSDLGKIALALTEAGLMEQIDESGPPFEGLYTLETLFPDAAGGPNI